MPFDRHAGLAPGTRIIAGARFYEIAGVAGVFEVRAVPHLVTCGHVFEPDAIGSEVYAADDEQEIAVLSVNFLLDDPPLDAAVCELNDHGVQRLLNSAIAESWYRIVATPAPADESAMALFWPTHQRTLDWYQGLVTSHLACEYELWNHKWGYLPSCDLVQTQRITSPGDSGSALILGSAGYGLCGGAVGAFSYFTSLASVLERCQMTLGSTLLWSP